LTPTNDHTRAGFTLIELLVAAAAMFMIIGYTMATFTLQHQTYVVVDQVSETQQNTRAIAALLERDARNAGYLVPPSSATCGIDNTNAPDVVYLSDADAIRAPDELGSTLASQVLGSDVTSITSGTPDTIAVDDLVIDEEATYDTDADGTADSDFQVGGGIIIVDVANPDRGVLCGTITAISPGTPDTISANLTATAWTAAASNVAEPVAVPAHAYQLTGTSPPALMRDGSILAKDVEDLQVAWFLDADSDNEVEGTEFAGDATTNTYDPQGQDGSELREMRVNLVLRTRENDPRNPTEAGIGQETENRDTNVATADGRRRRIHSVTVRLRNLPST
jgi:type II secretory pathway pseudopilin PulG